VLFFDGFQSLEGRRGLFLDIEKGEKLGYDGHQYLY